MKKIPLTQNKFAIVDDEDYEFLSQWKWYYKNGYAIRAINCGKINNKIKIKTIMMHRVILKTSKEKHTDHINWDGLDNRKCNLRECTHSENHMNIRKKEGCTSKYIGVYWHKLGKKWISFIRVKGKKKYLGLFKLEKQAAEAYNIAALKYGTGFHTLNEI